MVLCGHLLCLFCQGMLVPENQGVIQGVASSFGSIASIIGLILGGILYSTIGASTFLISAAVIFLVFILSFRLLNYK